MTDFATELVAERSVTMGLMHIVIGLISNIATILDDDAIADELLGDMKSFADSVGIDPAEATAAHLSPAFAAKAAQLAKARFRAVSGAAALAIEEGRRLKNGGAVN